MVMGLTRLSPRGQIVIPQDIRKGFEVGDKFFIVKENNRIILTREEDVEASVLDDLEFERRTREAEKRMDAGEFISVDSDNLEEEMMKW
jgi:bifunctional DNA-binding transcriptional regulator/antitoxin component of YhaV-PrlF toxin-antitoxin module